ncbi:MAG TPA: hypothetical protein VM364_05825 [Vicinamibacterales bacterium]|nr:hypothetical protein [Vicinamibacterales bacterium]
MFSLSGAAYGMAQGLREVQEDRRRDLQLKLNQQALLRALAGDEEDKRRWAQDFELRSRGVKSLEDARAAEAARDRADAEARANRAQGIQRLLSEPSELSSLTPLQRVLLLNQHGVNNVSIHDLEQPEEHAAHVRADKDSAFADWQRRADYTEQQRRTRPPREITGRLVKDDPAFPYGVQDYVVQLRAKHPTFEAAAGELSRQMPNLRQSHPNLSSEKALNALRQSFTGAGQGDGLSQFVQSAIQGSSFAGGGRGENPSQTSPPAAVPEAPAPVDDAQLRDAARAALRLRLKREPTDSEIGVVLKNEHNRRLLMGAR